MNKFDSIIFQKLISISRSYQKSFGCHGWEHTERTIEMCKYLGNKLGANMKLLIPAAILHDIGRNKSDHAIESAKIAESILRDSGFNKDQIKKIQDIIVSHSFSLKKKVNSLEEMILSDADKLDAMGAIGVYRAAMYNCEQEGFLETFIEHFHVKLLKLKNLLYTQEAKRIAETKHNFLVMYLNELKRELAF